MNVGVDIPRYLTRCVATFICIFLIKVVPKNKNENETKTATSIEWQAHRYLLCNHLRRLSTQESTRGLIECNLLMTYHDVSEIKVNAHDEPNKKSNGREKHVKNVSFILDNFVADSRICERTRSWQGDLHSINQKIRWEWSGNVAECSNTN